MNDPAAGTAACTKKPPVRCTVAMTMLLAVTPASDTVLDLSPGRERGHPLRLVNFTLLTTSRAVPLLLSASTPVPSLLRPATP